MYIERIEKGHNMEGFSVQRHGKAGNTGKQMK